MRKFFVPITLLIISFCIIFTFVKTKDIHYFIPNNIQYNSLSKPLQKQVDCLAENIYFEAAHETKEGKMAVAFVTLNRLSSGNYSDDICGVVNQKTNGTCQFSWVCMPIFANQRLTIKNTVLYNEIRQLSVFMILNYEHLTDITKGSTYYHGDYVNPEWGLPISTKIGRHIFYLKNRDVSNIDRRVSI